MIINNQEFIGTKEAAQILGFQQVYVRELCAREEYKEKFNAIKFSGRWILQKQKVERCAEEKKKRSK